MINRILKVFPLQKFTISGHSMEPTIRDGESVLVNRLAFLFSSPQKNDIVAAKIDGNIFIKRISQRKKNKYFLVGDNPKDSLDSRKLGFISKKNILGKVILH